MTSRSPITTDADWLINEHAGQLLVSEFLQLEELSVGQLAADINVAQERLVAVIECGFRERDGLAQEWLMVFHHVAPKWS